jgi:hypothetical protein
MFICFYFDTVSVGKKDELSACLLTKKSIPCIIKINHQKKKECKTPCSYSLHTTLKTIKKQIIINNPRGVTYAKTKTKTNKQTKKYKKLK